MQPGKKRGESREANAEEESSWAEGVRGAEALA